MTTLPLVRPPSTWARAWGASSNRYAYGFDPTYAGLQTGGEPTGEEEGLDG